MLCCKLTDAHINPNNFQKMNVRLAAQLFSKRNALGFYVYRQMQAKTENEKRLKRQFAGTESIEKLTNLLNDTFDVQYPAQKSEHRFNFLKPPIGGVKGFLFVFL
ncbi:Uncharacterized protein APZ42_009109 [Daphnia magna]|uniref:Transposable element P transposase-like GTP-binding insertion domain-containing protein n=1 Tax=Daphnia magna TaxID=35525 RepID=A0A164E7L8_9CRUS|nr:Uncharacterized protein APZ42_009109 [Daphnia magna]